MHAIRESDISKISDCILLPLLLLELLQLVLLLPISEAIDSVLLDRLVRLPRSFTALTLVAEELFLFLQLSLVLLQLELFNIHVGSLLFHRVRNAKFRTVDWLEIRPRTCFTRLGYHLSFDLLKSLLQLVN